MKFFPILIFIILSSFKGVSFSASFNCNKASTKTEKTICNTPEINRLDDTLGKLYSIARKKVYSEKKEEQKRILNQVKSAQKDWILNTQVGCNADVSCLIRVYNSRIEEFKNFLKGEEIKPPPNSVNWTKMPDCPSSGLLGEERSWDNCYGYYEYTDGSYDSIEEVKKHRGLYLTYEGEWKNGKYDGKGVLVDALSYYSPGGRSVSIYEGEFKEGEFHGQGKIVNKSQAAIKNKGFVSYEGRWVMGKKYGMGTYTRADGSTYSGGISNGYLQGRGVYTRPSGSRYEGTYKKNKRHGQGTYTFANGDKYVGEWKDDKIHGQGTFYNADGSIKQKGYFKDNKLVEGKVSEEEKSNESTSSSGNSNFDKYKTDAEMKCLGDKGSVIFTLKGDRLIMLSSDDIMSFELGKNLERNGNKLEFIAKASFIEIYVNFKRRTAKMMGFPFQCY